jgi:mono/diheme cytochrome c family protein
MTRYRWLTVSAAIVITALEVWSFSGSNAPAAQPEAPAAAGPTEPPTTAVPASAHAATPADSDVSEGQALYSAYCAACHQVNGEGVAGTFPPLKASGVVNRADATVHIDIVLNGLQGARASGVTYATPMPPFAATLSDAAIAAIVDYERSAWGNHGVLVSPAQVAGERARLK